MQKWEYLTFQAYITKLGYLRVMVESEDPKFAKDLRGKGGNEILDYLGSQGWELTNVINGHDPSSLIFFFKRPQI